VRPFGLVFFGTAEAVPLQNVEFFRLFGMAEAGPFQNVEFFRLFGMAEAEPFQNVEFFRLCGTAEAGPFQSCYPSPGSHGKAKRGWLGLAALG